MSRDAAGSALCPSAPAAAGASLIGVVDAKGRVVHLITPLVVDENFVEVARRNGTPERRFRFSAPCQEGRCSHWAGQQCGLIGKLHGAAAEIGLSNDEAPLPPCTIRSQCRWWQQRGRQACGVCSVVVTDQRLPAS